MRMIQEMVGLENDFANCTHVNHNFTPLVFVVMEHHYLLSTNVDN